MPEDLADAVVPDVPDAGDVPVDRADVESDLRPDGPLPARCLPQAELPSPLVAVPDRVLSYPAVARQSDGLGLLVYTQRAPDGTDEEVVALAISAEGRALGAPRPLFAGAGGALQSLEALTGPGVYLLVANVGGDLQYAAVGSNGALIEGPVSLGAATDDRRPAHVYEPSGALLAYTGLDGVSVEVRVMDLEGGGSTAVVPGRFPHAAPGDTSGQLRLAILTDFLGGPGEAFGELRTYTADGSKIALRPIDPQPDAMPPFPLGPLAVRVGEGPGEPLAIAGNVLRALEEAFLYVERDGERQLERFLNESAIDVGAALEPAVDVFLTAVSLRGRDGARVLITSHTREGFVPGGEVLVRGPIEAPPRPAVLATGSMEVPFLVLYEGQTSAGEGAIFALPVRCLR